ncbi:MAG TPA: hypothetical protein VKT78_13605, partial [Fimbriimonadaceae bacterium]|nr:hypothetical protein [Fimbriimonadaceae bacterium]
MILQILPTVPPEINGLADYAVKLQKHWPDAEERWRALAMRIPANASNRWPSVPVDQMPSDAAGLVAKLGERSLSCVLLHYVPHAYDPNGVPDWLVDGLSEWKRSSRVPLFAIYHELYVWAKPWQRARLFIKPSIRCFRRLAALPGGWVTSNERYHRLAVAEGADPNKGGIVPIGANIEPVSVETPKEAGTVALFGLPSSRLRAARWHRRLLADMVDTGLGTNIVEIGAAASETEQRQLLSILPATLAQNRATLFDAEEAQVSAALWKAEFGLCAVEAPNITRSGVYAAYCGHGVIPIAVGARCEGSPPFIANDDRRPNQGLQQLNK